MTKEEYLKNLENELISHNIQNVDSIMKKYAKSFEIAEAADISVEETIERLGTIDEVVGRYSLRGNDDSNNQNSGDKKSSKKYRLKISGVPADNVSIKYGNVNHIIVDIDGELENKIDIEKNDNSLVITGKEKDGTTRVVKGKAVYNDDEYTATGDINIEIPFGTFSTSLKNYITDGNIKIEIPYDTEFSDFLISLAMTDIYLDEIKAENFILKTINGDASIKKVEADNIKLGAVNGDIKVDKITGDNICFSTVSGDLAIERVKANLVKISVVTGDCKINNIKLTGRIAHSNSSKITGKILYNEVKVND
jgi:hypothetical protein